MRRQRALLPYPALMLVTDSSRGGTRAHTGESWLDDVVRDAVLGGVNVVQLREKSLARGDLIALGLHVRDAIAGRAMFVVNGDVDAAIALEADGVHLPEDGPSVEQVRAQAGDRLWISRAVHDADAAARAEREGADAVVFGSVFDSASHPGAAPAGVDAMCAAAAAVTIPVIGIGGIDAGNAAEVLRAGASGVAVISAIFDAVDARSAAAGLSAALAGSVSRS